MSGRFWKRRRECVSGRVPLWQRKRVCVCRTRMGALQMSHTVLRLMDAHFMAQDLCLRRMSPLQSHSSAMKSPLSGSSCSRHITQCFPLSQRETEALPALVGASLREEARSAHPSSATFAIASFVALSCVGRAPKPRGSSSGSAPLRDGRFCHRFERVEIARYVITACRRFCYDFGLEAAAEAAQGR